MANFHTKMFSVTYVILFMLYLCPSVSARHFDEKYLETGSVPNSVNGDTWYVDVASGDDKNDGKTPGTAFKTLAKCFDRYRSALNGGDVVKIMAGTYHERITIGNVYTSPGNPLVIGPYGNGKVVIDASDTHLLSWVKYDDNMYVTDFSSQKLSGNQAEPNAVILNDNFKLSRPVKSLADMSVYGRWYYDKVGNKLFVHTGGAHPASLSVIVTKFDPNNVEYGIYGVGAPDQYSYIEIYGVTLLGAASWGIWLSGDYCKVENSVVKYSGKGGIELKGSFTEIKNNLVADNILMNWPRGRTWDTSGGWPISLLFGPAATVYGNIVHDNGGEGIGGGGPEGGTTIDSNISYNNWSVNIYVDNSPNFLIKNNYVYGAQPNPAEMIDATDIPSWTSYDSILRRMNPQGIVLGDETAASIVARSRDTKIVNNLIVGCRGGFTHYGQADQAGLINILIANNTIIVPNRFGPGEENFGLKIPYNDGNNLGTVIKNNIIFGQHPETPLIELRGGVEERGITWDNNLYFDEMNSTPFVMGYSDGYNFVSWQSTLNQDSKSIYLNPEFIGVSGSAIIEKYYLGSNSPAIGKAEPLSEFLYDFNYYTRGSTWDIGFVEYVAQIPMIKKIKIQ